MEEGWKENDESMNNPPLECHKAQLSPASSKEIDNWVCTTAVLH